MFNRQEIEKFEKKFLSSYAMKSKDSRGRKHHESEHPYRTAFQRDRDRIIHCTAFRRLEYKTQVFVNYEGDYYRTRLTHTLEVAQIAKTIARTLRLNEDLVEAISLAHDLGHTPFGHAGEETLRQLMQGHGGFEHNRQGLRVVDYLEERYPDFKGLNLSWEVREGILKHVTAYDHPEESNEFKQHRFPTLEAQVVDLADEIAYDNHDLDDGITSRFIDVRPLSNIELWRQAEEKISKKYSRLKDEIKKYQIIKFLINLQVQDVIKHTDQKLKKADIHSLDDAKNYKERLVGFSPEIAKKCAQLREFLNQNLYQHYKVVRMSNKARRFIQELFQCYISNPKQLPPTSLARVKKENVHRVVCDYIAGMTDRYAQNEYRRLFQPYEEK
ncbi:MAG: deoxyguanosinetriphosphate triphosphohydrolase [Candidatus Omnitrophica bacterium]|nr:deoxyguanosinetriphosphate triphosphohydrolase [Candidatus Omnitrophota bacterium]